MPNPVSWFQIQGKDGGPLVSFYQDLFGWKSSQQMPDGGAMIDAEEGGIAGGIGPTQDGSDRNVAVYVEVDSVNAYLARGQAAGGLVAMPRTELPAGMGFIGGVVDPAGNFTGLWEPSEEMLAAKAAEAAAAAEAARKAAAPKKKKAKKKKAKKKTAKRKAKKKTAKRKAKKKTAKRKAKKKTAKKKAGKRKAKKKAGKRKAKKKAGKRKAKKKAGKRKAKKKATRKKKR